MDTTNIYAASPEVSRMIVAQRMTSQADGDFCVFLIGMRVNRWWKVHKWWPVAMAMPRMLKELAAHPEI